MMNGAVSPVGENPPCESPFQPPNSEYCLSKSLFCTKKVGIEKRDGNANVRFHQAETLERIYSNIEGHGIKIGSSRMDYGSYSQDIIKVVMAHSERFYIRGITPVIPPSLLIYR